MIDYVWLQPVESSYDASETSITSNFFCVDDEVLGTNFTEIFASYDKTRKAKGT